jgi:hypothetical protein
MSLDLENNIRNITLSETFTNLLKTLCLDEYPCINIKQNNVSKIKFNLENF